jgi:Right handed beta helix region
VAVSSYASVPCVIPVQRRLWDAQTRPPSKPSDLQRDRIYAPHRIDVDNSTNVNVRNNTVTGFTRGIGVFAGCRGCADLPGREGNRIEGNDVTFNGEGIRIGTRQANLVVRGNAADHNARDGIVVSSPTTTVSGNRAWWNGDLGIEALSGVGGGDNWAKHNGNPLQCVPVTFCSTTGKPKG